MKTKINKGLMSSNTGEWATPQNLFDQLNDEFHFTLDVAATSENAKCKKYFTKETNGLLQAWENDIVYMNPPYGSEISKWMKKAEKEGQLTTIVCLVPARTDTIWFYSFVMQAEEIRFVKGRLKFNDGNNSVPFPSMIVIFRPVFERTNILNVPIIKTFEL